LTDIEKDDDDLTDIEKDDDDVYFSQKPNPKIKKKKKKKEQKVTINQANYEEVMLVSRVNKNIRGLIKAVYRYYPKLKFYGYSKVQLQDAMVIRDPQFVHSDLLQVLLDHKSARSLPEYSCRECAMDLRDTSTKEAICSKWFCQNEDEMNELRRLHLIK